METHKDTCAIYSTQDSLRYIFGQK